MKAKIDTTAFRRLKQSFGSKLDFREDRGTEFESLTVEADAYDQTWIGFGGAATESSAYCFNRLGPENQNEFLNLYFGRDGSRYNLLRTHIDSCDFSLDMYEALSDADDSTFETFSLKRDDTYIVPFIKAAEACRGEKISLLLSPWSPPSFMKSNGKRKQGGHLLPEYRERWAAYIARYIQEYEKRGVQVDRLTIQNEPNAAQSWDSCLYSPQDERAFLTQFLYPQLREAGLEHVKIAIWDHNKERLYERACNVLEGEAREMAASIAFHWYTGDHFDAVRLTHEQFPEKELIHTEGCVGFAKYESNQLQNAEQYAHDIIGNLNAGMQAYYDWNLLLDSEGGPNHVGNFCAAPIMCDLEKDTLHVQLSYWYLRHFSHAIRPGARRLWSSAYSPEVEHVAFENPDGTVVVLLLNRTKDRINFSLRFDGQAAEIELPRHSLSTVTIER